MKLRIIAGELKGRYIYAPESKFTRPTTDRVRETLFNLLINRLDFEDIDVLDIYAGSGSLGFESISRGAKTLDFIEKNAPVYRNLEKNIELLNLGSCARIIKEEATNYTMRNLSKKYDLILADPPFFEYDIYKVVENVLKNNMIRNEGIMVIERSIQTIKQDVEAFTFEPQKRIGDTCLYFWEM